MAADGTKVPKEVPEQARDNRPLQHIVVQKPGRKTVVAAVAKMLRYPAMLLDPKVPIEDVITYLNVRHGRRLVARFGCFRDKRT
jgi:hypothetical protein